MTHRLGHESDHFHSDFMWGGVIFRWNVQSIVELCQEFWRPCVAELFEDAHQVVGTQRPLGCHSRQFVF